MKISHSFVIFHILGLVTGAPFLEERATKDKDGLLLNYALTLEHIQDNFYRQGLAKFSQADFQKAGFDKTVYDNVKKISKDESDHVAFITNGVKTTGGNPVKACKYQFPYDGVAEFLTTAAIIESVGVSAYIGAAAAIVGKTHLTAAGSILAVEARHTSYLRSKLQVAPFPQAFDVPLPPRAVYSLASQFITSCPSSNPPLQLKAFPKLESAQPVTITSAAVTLQTPGYTIKLAKGAKIYAAFVAATGPTFIEAKQVTGGFTVKVPVGFVGQTYVFLTRRTALDDSTVAAGPAILQV